MSLRPYSQYAECDLAWLGSFPAHWTLTKTKHICEFSTGWTPPTGNAAAYDGDCLWANISDLGPRVVSDTAKTISHEAALEHGINQAPIGSLMFSFKLSIGQVSFVGRPMFTNEAIATFRGSPALLLSFAYYAFPLFLVQNAADNIYGAKLLNQSLIRAATFPLPPPEEQSAIAAFLDRETAKIDALIAEQEKLIALLAEKRQATISHAVTKGLNPDAPMKDSGVPWLGEVPGHWEINRLKSISPQITVGIVVEPSKYYVDSGVPALRSLNVAPGRVVEDNFVFIPVESNELLSKSRLRAGDLVSVRSGQTGTTAVVPESLDGCNCIDLIIIRKPRDDSEQFLCWFLGSDAAIQQFSSGSGGAIQQHFNIGTAMNLQIPLPPREEQDAIVKFLEAESAKIESLHRASEQSIDLLQERRSALIAAAVTGQIDVRGLY